ncbi:MAG: hypothetical protein V7L25_10685 [Nostoc sp.]|uniref:hypothetical protein n=1 Tax=Nostoc sp. TaxID=1180 RepID=UPI002FEEEB49
MTVVLAQLQTENNIQLRRSLKLCILQIASIHALLVTPKYAKCDTPQEWSSTIALFSCLHSSK